MRTVVAWLHTGSSSRRVERQWSEDADALADDHAARLDAEPTVVRPRLRTLFNDLYRLNDEPKNDWMNETQRAEAEEETMAAFAEKLEDLSPAVKRSQQNRKRQAEIEARRAELDALILAEEDGGDGSRPGQIPGHQAAAGSDQ